MIEISTEGPDGSQTCQLEADSPNQLKETVVTYDGSTWNDASQYLTGSCGDVNQTNVPQEITTTNGTADFTEDQGAIAVDGNLTVNGTDNYTAANVSINEGFNPGADVLAVNDSYSSSSITIRGYNSTTGVLKLSGEATAIEYQSALRNVTYNNTESPPSTADRNITFTLISANSSIPSDPNVVYNPRTGHYYEYVEDPGVGWESAKSAASSQSYAGMSGYLVTITSEQENDFLLDKFQAEGWMGATDKATEGKWRWVTGPEGDEDGGSGRYFYNQTAAHVAWTDPYPAPPAGVPGGGNPVGSNYSNWDTQRHEPDNKFPFFGGQDYAYFCTKPPGRCPSGMWMDASNTTGVGNSFSPTGYFIEYGGQGTSPDTQTENLSTSKTITISTAVSDSTVPTAVASTNVTSVPPGKTIQLDGSGSTDDESGIARYEWDITGNGRTDLTGQTNTTSFQNASDYTVTLTVTDNGGNTDTDTTTITVEDTNSPNAVISVDGSTTVGRGETVQFTGTNSTDDVAIQSFEWDFGDGSANVSSVSPVHGYDKTGTYTVTLVVNDTSDNTDTATETIDVTSSSRPVISDFNATNPTGQDLNVSITSGKILNTITVEVYNTSQLTPRADNSGALERTLTESDFTEQTQDGNNTYTNTTTDFATGNYTLRLQSASNASDGDSGTGQEATVTLTQDTTSPYISDSNFTLTNPANRNLTVTFISNESLSAAEVSIANITAGNNTTVATVLRDDLKETDNGDGTYTYTNTSTVATAGTYEGTLKKAEDATGNDGASGQNDTATIGSIDPAYQSSEVTDANAGELRVTFDANVSASNADGVSLDSPRDLVIDSLSNIENNNTVVLNLNRSITANESLSVSYDNSAGTVVSAEDGSDAQNFSTKNVTNNIAAIEPTYQSSEVTDANTNQLYVTFDANVSVQNATGFSLDSPDDLLIDSFASVEDGDTVVLTLNRSVNADETLFVSYDNSTGAVVSAEDGSAVQNLSGERVTNTISTVRPAYQSSEVTDANADQLRITFDANVSVQDATGFSFDSPEDLAITGYDSTVNNDTVVLNLNRSITSNESLSVSYDNATGTVVSAEDGSEAQNFSTEGVTNNIAAIEPTYQSSEVTDANADQLRVTFGAKISASNADGFSLSSPANLSIQSLSTVENNDTVVLSLNRSVNADETLSVNYDNSKGTVVSSEDGSAVQNFSGENTTNTVSAVVPAPSNVSATVVSGGNINVQFDDLDNGVVQYTVYRNNTSTAAGFANITTITDDNSSTYTYTDSGLEDGTRYNYTVAATDDSGTDGSNSSITSATADATAPTIGAIRRASPTRSDTDADSVTFTVTFSEAIEAADTDDFELNTGSGVSATISTVNASSGTALNVTVSSISGTGTLELNVSDGADIRDNAGNTLDSTEPTTDETYSIDTDAPSVSSASITNAPIAKSDAGTEQTVTVTFSEEMNTTVAPTVEITNVSDAPLSVSGSYDNATTWTGTVTIADNDEDTTATIAVSGAADTSGNMMSPNPDTTSTFDVDAVEPSVSTSYSAGNLVTGAVDLTGEFTITNDDGGSTTYEYDEGSGFTTIDSPGSWDTTNATDGNVTLRVIDTDDAGNTNRTSVTVRVDNTAPVVTDVIIIDDTDGDGTVSTGDQIEITATVTDSNAISSVEANASAFDASTVTLADDGPNSTAADNQYSANVTVGESSTTGSQSVTVSATDEASNGGSQAVASGTLSVDTVSPSELSIDTPGSEAATGSGDTLEVGYSYTDDNPNTTTITLSNGSDTVTYTIDDSTYAADGTTKTINLDLGAPDSTGASGLVDGATYDIEVKTTDASGQSSSVTGTDLVTIDDTAPTIGSPTPSDGATVSDTSQTYTVTISDSTAGVNTDSITVTVTDSGGTVLDGAGTDNSNVSFSSGTLTISGPTYQTGQVDVTVDADDIAGNAAPTFTSNYTIQTDTSAPTVESITRKSPTSQTTNADSVTFTVTFSESVSGIDTDDFTTNTGSGVTASVSDVNASSGTAVNVTVGSITGDGSLGLNVSDRTDIQDDAGNTLDSSEPTTDEAYTVDNTAPTIDDSTVAADNTYVEVTFSEGVYTDADGSGGLTAGDFTYNFTANGGTATDVSIDSVIATDSGSLSGGETTVRVNISAVNGPASGVETVEIQPADGASIYDETGNGVSATESTAVRSLNDRVSPTVSSVSLGNDGSDHLAVSFNSSEQLSTIVVTVDGPSTTDAYSFDQSDFGESGTGPYTYTLTTAQAFDDGSGTYTVTIDDAIDNTGNNGGTNGSGSGLADSHTYENDTSAPAFVAGYPITSNVTSEGFDIDVQANETGTAYYVVVTNGSGRPSVSQIKNGQDAGASPAEANGSGAISADTEATFTVSGLSSETVYDVYVVVEDAADNAVRSSKVVEATSDGTAPTIADVNVTVTNPQNRDLTVSITSDEQLATINATLTNVTAGNDTTVVNFEAIDFQETANGGGTYTYTNTSSVATDSTYEVTLTRAEDTAGNDGASNQSDTVTVGTISDQTAPTIADGNVTVTNHQNRNITVSITSNEQLGTIEATLTNTTAGNNTEIQTLTTNSFSETSNNDGTYTYTNTSSVATDGTYEATLTRAEDTAGNDGASGQDRNVTVTADLNAEAFASSYVISVNDSITLRSGQSLIPAKTTPSFQWTIGQSVKHGKNVTHRFATPGTYDVTLAVTAAGGTSQDTITITVRDNSPPTIVTGSDRTIREGDNITFDATGSSDDIGIVSYAWDVDGDGTIEATTASTDYTYIEPGTYDATVTVEDAAGNTAETTITVTIRGPEANVNTSSIAFENVTTRSAGVATINITNTGNDQLNLTGSSISGANSSAFRLSASGSLPSVRAGETRSLVVLFEPQSPGSKSATLQLSTNDDDTATITTELAGTGVSGDLVANRSHLGYTTRKLGTTTHASIVLDNIGRAPVNVSAVRVEGTGHEQFRLVDGANQSFTLGTGQTRVITVAFEPTATGTHTGTLVAQSEQSNMSVTLEGTGSAPDTTFPDLEQGNVSFPEIGKTNTTTKSITLSNYGTETLNITDVRIIGQNASAFTVTSAPSTVSAGASQTVTARFQPQSAGNYSATLLVNSNDPDEPNATVPLRATAVAATIDTSPSSLHFSGSGETLNVTVRNLQTSKADLRVSQTSLVGRNPGSFTITNGTAPFTLTPGETRQIELTFTPVENGTKSAQLRILSDSAENQQIDVWLTNTRTYVVIQSMDKKFKSQNAKDAINIDANNVDTSESLEVNISRPRTRQRDTEIQDLQMSSNVSSQFQMNVSYGDTPVNQSVPGLTQSATTPLEYIELDHPTTTFDNTSIDYRVRKSALPQGASSGSITMWRYSNGQWNALDSTVVKETSTYYHLQVDTPGFSQFVLSADSQSSPSGNDPDDDSSGIDSDDDSNDSDRIATPPVPTEQLTPTETETPAPTDTSDSDQNQDADQSSERDGMTSSDQPQDGNEATTGASNLTIELLRANRTFLTEPGPVEFTVMVVNNDDETRSLVVAPVRRTTGGSQQLQYSVDWSSQQLSGSNGDTDTLWLTIDGEPVESRNVTIPPGESQNVTYTYVFETSGQHRIVASLNNQTASANTDQELTAEVEIIVDASADSATCRLFGVNFGHFIVCWYWWVLLVVLLVLLLLWQRRRADTDE